MKTIRSNAKQLLVDNYRAYLTTDGERLSTSEWAKLESENDPDFYRWLLNDSDVADFGSNLSDDENQVVSNFIQSL